MFFDYNQSVRTYWKLRYISKCGNLNEKSLPPCVNVFAQRKHILLNTPESAKRMKFLSILYFCYDNEKQYFFFLKNMHLDK